VHAAYWRGGAGAVAAGRRRKGRRRGIDDRFRDKKVGNSDVSTWNIRAQGIGPGWAQEEALGAVEEGVGEQVEDQGR
jgi:hypothetical protein